MKGVGVGGVGGGGLAYIGNVHCHLETEYVEKENYRRRDLKKQRVLREAVKSLRISLVMSRFCKQIFPWLVLFQVTSEKFHLPFETF